MAHVYKTIRDFANACLNSNIGFVDQSNPVYNGQCVALVKNHYAKNTTVPNPYGARGNGKDVASTLVNQGYGKRIYQPQAGAVISYPATPSNPYGHVAIALSSTEMIEQNSAWLPNNGTNPNGTYKPRVCAIRGGYSYIALPQGFYQDAPTTSGVTTASFKGTYKCLVNNLKIRTAPGLDGPDTNLRYNVNDTVNLDGWYALKDNYIWGRYTSYEGKVRYVAIGPNTGKVSKDTDYLIKL